MCGLAGQFCFSDHRGTADVLKVMLVAQELRGRDAAGVAYLREGQVVAAKKAVTPRTFVRDLPRRAWEEIADSPVVLMHARHATQGSEKQNENNHPVVACDWVVTHNGHVRNDDDLIAQYEMTAERPAEVDTVAINMALAQGETAEEGLSHISLLEGAATFFAWNFGKPEEVILARVSGPPLYLHYDKERQILFWSSDVDGLRNTMRPGLGNVKFANIATMPQNTAFILTKEEIKQYELTVTPFRLPKVKKENKTATYPLVQTNFPTNTIRTGPQTTIGSALPPVGRQVSESPTSSLQLPVIQIPHALASVMRRWFEAVNGEGGEELFLLSPRCNVTCLEDYKQLGKPSPNFEPEMVGLAYLPLTKGSVTTPYGTWLLTPHNRWFRGAKRVKRYWEQKISPALSGVSVSLPLLNRVAFDALADKHKLEVVHLYITPDKPTDYTVGLMCPWCGIISKPMVWKAWKYICAWCNVQSKYDGGSVK